MSDAARVGALYRYPVKGFPAELLSAAHVRARAGIDGDRAFALSNGLRPPAPGQWSSCGEFTALKSDTSLQTWRVRSTTRGRATDVVVHAPDGASITVSSDDDGSLAGATSFFTSRLDARGDNERALVAAGQGMFDSQASGISIINPATVAALGEASGYHLDPLRFRGNLSLEGMPAYGEIDLIGRILTIGTTRLWVRKSIERCSATRVDPASGEASTNVPQLLAGHFGHLHCGVYAVVLDDGDMTTGDTIAIGGRLTSVPAGLDAALAAPRSSPRIAEVRSVDVSGGVARIELLDPLGWTHPHHTPGQNLRVHPVVDGLPTWRAYTITRLRSDVDGDVIELRVALDGVVSRHLAGLTPGSALVISGPHGRLTPERLGPRPVAVVAGIGVTPALALTSSLGTLPVFHVERGVPGRESVDLGASADVTHWSTSARGRPGVDDIAAWLRRQEASDVVVCGPRGLGSLVREAAARVGVTAVHEEVFTSPVVVTAVPDLPDARVTVDGRVITWRPDDGLLLDALEQAGERLESTCRGGACGDCAVTLRAGSVQYPIEPAAAVSDGEVLLCCSYPVGDVVLERRV